MSAQQEHALSVSIEAVGHDQVPLLRLVSVLATRQVHVRDLSFVDQGGTASRVSARIVLRNAHAGTVAAALGRVVGVTSVDLRPVR